MNYIDLTHTFKHDMPVYPGDPKAELEQKAFLDNDGYNDYQIRTGMHVGTHIDAPLHMLRNGKRLSEYPPEYFFGKGHMIDARGKSIDEKLLTGLNLSNIGILLVMTGFYKKFGTLEYFEKYPEITESFALKVIKFGIKIIGLDTPSPDRPPFSVHKLLLNNEVLIIENLANLESLLKHSQFEIAAPPAKFDTEAAPVRVVAMIE